MPDGADLSVAGEILLWLLLAVLFTGPWSLPWLGRRLRAWREDVQDRRVARQPVVVPVGRYVDDLRRLSRDLASLPAGAPWARQHGTQMAYDSILTKLCDALEIDHQLAATPMGWSRDMERLRMEDAVYAKGLRIHPVGT